MKTNNQKPTHPQTIVKNRPENKDNLDSREGEEQLSKGKNVTHNKKEKHNDLKNK